MFEHSVKVPRHYKIAANIFKKVATEGGSVKTLLYDDKLKHFRTNVLFALITEAVKHASTIDKLFENCSLLQNEPRLDPWLAKILTVELLFGKKILPGNSKPEQTILSYKEKFEKYSSDNQIDLKTEVVRRPRYVRINTNLLTTSDAIRCFQDEGYRFIRCTSSSYDDYLKQIKDLTEYDFTQDYHVKTIFVFAPGTKLHDHELYLENQIILQDKATALAVHMLAPPAGSCVLDLCAAPGMKTTQLAAFMRNQGKIYAIERNERRYETLCEFVKKTNCTCVETLNKDSLDIKRGDYDDVEYILLDPSCSGSGMELSMHNYIDATRLSKLTSLQEKFLKHAMNSFPNAKKIVYSTCSLFPEENERVITNVVKTSRAKWRVQDVKELLKNQWNNIGSGMYGSMGTRCIYAKPDNDLTTGFFLAVLERDPKDFERYKNKESNNKEKDNLEDNINNSVSKNQEESDYDETKHVSQELNDSIGAEYCKKSKKKKKNKKKDIENDAFQSNDKNVTEEVNELDNVKENKIKKKKNKRNDSSHDQENNAVESQDDVVENKNNKRKLKSNVEDENNFNNSKNLNDSVETKKKKRKKEKKYIELEDSVSLEIIKKSAKKHKKSKHKEKSE